MMSTYDLAEPGDFPDWECAARACELLDWRTDHVDAGPVTTIPANVVLGAE